MTWSQKATPAGRLISRLRASARSIDGNDSGSWPTPNAAQHKNGNGFGMTLGMAATLSSWPSPDARQGRGGICSDPNDPIRPRERGNAKILESEVLLASWATPTTRDHKDGETERYRDNALHLRALLALDPVANR
jgi:hypothetical protein